MGAARLGGQTMLDERTSIGLGARTLRQGSPQRRHAARAILRVVKIVELGHLVLYVRDIDASAAFYTNVLGFRPVIDRPPGQRGVMYRTGSDRTHHELLIIEGAPDSAPLVAGARLGLFHFGLKIGDSDAELIEGAAELRAAGVEITAAVNHGATKSLYVADPDGNEIELYVDVPGVDWRSDPTVINKFEPIEI